MKNNVIKKISDLFSSSKDEPLSATLKSQQFRKGGYNALLAVLSLAVVIAINLVIGALPSTYTKHDVSMQKFYSFTAQTIETVKGVEDDIKFYFLTESGSEDQMIKEILSRFAELNNNISVEVIDKVLFPDFSKQYSEEELYNNTVIAVGNGRSKVIEYGDIYPLNYPLYYMKGTYEYDFDGEGQLVSAIEYITKEELPKMYNLTGHGEMEIPYYLMNDIEKKNIEISPISLLSNSEIPDDAYGLMIISPSKDLSDKEADIIISYLEDGGNVMLVTNYSEDAKPNLSKVMESYGIEFVDGLVFEGDPNKFILDHNNYILADMQFHDITFPLINNNFRVVIPNSQAAKELEMYRSTLSISPLLTTSNKSYSKVAGYRLTTREKEEGDIDGPLMIGIHAAENYNGIESNLIWFGSSLFLDEQININVSGANASLFINSIMYLCKYDSGLSIQPKSMGYEKIVLSSSQRVMWSIIFIIVIPLTILLIGFIVYLRRRNK